MNERCVPAPPLAGKICSTNELKWPDLDERYCLSVKAAAAAAAHFLRAQLKVAAGPTSGPAPHSFPPRSIQNSGCGPLQVLPDQLQGNQPCFVKFYLVIIGENSPTRPIHSAQIMLQLHSF